MSEGNIPKLVLLGSSSDSTNILHNSIGKHFNIVKVIIEEKESKYKFLKRRLRKIGYIKFLGFWGDFLNKKKFKFILSQSIQRI